MKRQQQVTQLRHKLNEAAQELGVGHASRQDAEFVLGVIEDLAEEAIQKHTGATSKESEPLSHER